MEELWEMRARMCWIFILRECNSYKNKIACESPFFFFLYASYLYLFIHVFFLFFYFLKNNL